MPKRQSGDRELGRVEGDFYSDPRRSKGLWRQCSGKETADGPTLKQE